MSRKLVALVFAVQVLAAAAVAEPRSFDWVFASNEKAQLNPADFHAGRVYRPGPDGGNIHVNIQATLPVTIAMTPAQAWNDALQHPEQMASLSFSCIREHVVTTTYECHLDPQTPMVLLVRDERTPDRALLNGIAAIVRAGAKTIIAPNLLTISYYRWDCVANCIQPEFQWVRLVKEKYPLTAVPKIYSLLTPEQDNQKIHIRFKSPAPMTLAVLPSKLADQIYANPSVANSALQGTTCKQRGVQSLAFECVFNIADGPQALVVLPDVPVESHKKAEVDWQTLKCVANCSLESK